MKFFFCIVLGFGLLLLPFRGLSQSDVIVSDGTLGIHSVTIRNDTAMIRSVIAGSPAEKAGLAYNDKIIKINDALVSGGGISTPELRQLLAGSAGDSIKLLIKSAGEESTVSHTLIFDPHLLMQEYQDLAYLVDSLGKWDIKDIVSDSLDLPFTSPIISKCVIHSVEKGSEAELKGLRPGDRILSLSEEMNGVYSYHIGMIDLDKATHDTSLTVLRDSTELLIDLNPSVPLSLDGIQSQYEYDLDQKLIWMKIVTRNRISASRSYLFSFQMRSEYSSVHFFELTATNELIEKKAGMLIPIEERDFIYKNWTAVPVHLIKGSKQHFYVRLYSDKPLRSSSFNVIPQETIIKHDRIERMILSGFYGMMLIISLYYLILFFSSRRKQFLFFSLFILSFGILLFTIEGFTGELNWQNVRLYSALVSDYDFLFYSVVSVCFLLLGNAYLDLKRTMIWWYRSVLLVAGLIVLSSLLLSLIKLFLPDVHVEIRTILILTWAISCYLIPLLILILPAILRISEGFKPGWYFLIANILLGISIFLSVQYSGYKFTIFNLYRSTFTTIILISSVYIASVLQFLLFSMGLARKMKLDEEEKKLAQEQVIEQLKENEKLKDKVNRELEQKVRERTSEINDQKVEIEAQRDEIEAQRDQLQFQKDLVEAQKEKITDSINYAQRIQAAVLPGKEYMDRVLPEYFVFFKPKDIVSGDFYWIKRLGHYLVLVVADCTGHGVPGGFMSMLGITLLNEQLGKNSFGRPGEILNQLRKKVKEILAQEGRLYEQKDGMDLALAVIDTDKQELYFAGAYNPLYLIRDKRKEGLENIKPYFSLEETGYKLFELKGDPQPIAVYGMERDFSTHKLKLAKGDSIYLFSDGYADQKGGPRNKKFLYKNFKGLILGMQSLSMSDQKKQLGDVLSKWQNANEQIDDILVLGVRI